MSNQQKTSIEQALEQVTPSRRRFLQQLLGGSAVALAIPASRLLAQPAQDGDGKGKGEGKGEGKGKGKGKGKGEGKGDGKGKGDQ